MARMAEKTEIKVPDHFLLREDLSREVQGLFFRTTAALRTNVEFKDELLAQYLRKPDYMDQRGIEFDHQGKGFYIQFGSHGFDRRMAIDVKTQDRLTHRTILSTPQQGYSTMHYSVSAMQLEGDVPHLKSHHDSWEAVLIARKVIEFLETR